MINTNQTIKKHQGNMIEAGQGLVEYALILVLVSIVVLSILSTLGPRLGNVFSEIVGSLSGLNSVVDNSAPTGPTWELLRNEMENCVPAGGLRNSLNGHINAQDSANFSTDVDNAINNSQITPACGYNLIGLANQL